MSWLTPLGDVRRKRQKPCSLKQSHGAQQLLCIIYRLRLWSHLAHSGHANVVYVLDRGSDIPRRRMPSTARLYEPALSVQSKLSKWGLRGSSRPVVPLVFEAPNLSCAPCTTLRGGSTVRQLRVAR